MYVKLCEGKCINKAEVAKYYGVDNRSIQRDIDDIRAFFDERSAQYSTDFRNIVYDRVKKGFVLVGEEGKFMSNGEILAISKILLESRAFRKIEIDGILNKLIMGCVPKKNVNMVSELISNERFHYVELNNKSSNSDILWDLGNYIKQCELIEITYDKLVQHREITKRTIIPVAILFSEYYFYLNAYIVEKREDKYVQVYDYPAIFRVDRIKEYLLVGEKFKIPYADRFEEGEYRKRIQFMYAGELIRIQFKYTGIGIEAIMDRLPTATIIKKEEETYIIEAEVYGKGILMWLLSQGDSIEVIKPSELREEIKNVLVEMVGKYQ